MFRGLVLEGLPDSQTALADLSTHVVSRPARPVFPDQTTHHPNFSRHMVQCDTKVGKNLLSERLCAKMCLFGISVCSVEDRLDT